GVPFGYVTGYDARRLGPEIGGRPVLAKPFNVRQLQTVLVGLARGRLRGPRRKRLVVD
ncbi:MAG: hypothetical protein JO128_09365, partial [Alphaproteobacteria bacterium]|nr:hypothetical protein [Alphaproteobacteria bacterium]